MKQCCLCLSARLHVLAYFASLDIGLYVLLQLGPPVLSEDQLLHFLDAWVSSQDVVVTLGDDFASQRGLPRDVDTSIVMQEASLPGDSSFMVEGCGNASVPQLILLGCILDLLYNFGNGGHNERPEVRGLEDDNVIVVLFPLVMVIAS